MRETKFYNNAGSVVAGTTGNYSNVVSITGAGTIDYIWMVATANTADLTNYALEIDGNTYAFDFTLYGLDEIVTQVITKHSIITNKKIIFNTGFKIKAKYADNDNITFKYSVMAHLLT